MRIHSVKLTRSLQIHIKTMMEVHRRAGAAGRRFRLCVVETTEVETKRFFKVDERFAYEEGEGDRSLTLWHQKHGRFFSRTLPAVGLSFSEDMPVFRERSESYTCLKTLLGIETGN